MLFHFAFVLFNIVNGYIHKSKVETVEKAIAIVIQKKVYSPLPLIDLCLNKRQKNKILFITTCKILESSPYIFPHLQE